MTCILDTIQCRAIQRVTLGHLRKDTHAAIFDRHLSGLKLWCIAAFSPDNLLATGNSMKCAMGRQIVYIYREIRRRHNLGYNLLNTHTGQLWAKTSNIGLRFKQGSKKWKADKVVTVTVGNEKRKVQGLASCALQQFVAQTNNAAPGIKNECMQTNLYFDT
jgi:hypothetical protein